MQDLLDLKGRTAYITGAGQGVGRRVALHFADHGAGAVIINDFRLERAQAVAEEVRATGAKALAVSGDVSDFDGVAASVKTAIDEFGGIDILVNNAGNAGPNPTDAMDRPFWEQQPSEWQGYLGTNLYGVLNTVHAVVPAMIKRRYGRIVNVISDAARFGEPNRECYAAGKAGTAGFTRSLAATVGRYTITANCVSLAATRTPRTEDKFTDEAAMKKLLSHYIIRRSGEPEDAANMILMLASDASSWVTGQVMPVNGGYSFAL
ncbi:SDR family NAD(P)-dependent oxidoreductase [Cumulibacter manganitolerans]|uniref:SDR family NAD(P)-dependent oxidoreductase n=1 Tax=Cumulibacter manganitolerans TaxID=1884992 RepID=UPI00129798EF|nr:SDR family NAD(P)-dependent oxidoreductase [Cumulibacter manganitolerans]